MWCIPDENEPLQPLLEVDGIDEPYNEPRQRLPKTYWQIGTLDVIHPEVILNKKSMSGKRIIPFIVDNTFAVDIDDIDSFEKAAKVIVKHNCVKF